MGEKAFLVAGKALPANIRTVIRRRNEGVVVFHLAIAAFAANRRTVDDLWVDILHHIQDLKTSIFSIVRLIDVVSKVMVRFTSNRGSF